MTEDIQHTKAGNMQKVGVSLSLLCSIHCLAMPFVIALLPAAGQVSAISPVWEWMLIGSSILMASWMLFKDHRRNHNRYAPLLLLGLGSLFFLIDQLGHHHEEEFHIFGLLAGLTVFIAYIVNWRMNRRYHSCSHTH